MIKIPHANPNSPLPFPDSGIVLMWIGWIITSFDTKPASSTHEEKTCTTLTITKPLHNIIAVFLI